MNFQQLKGNWQQVQGKIQQQWGKLTDDDLEKIHGDSNELIGKLVERYGIAKNEAQDQLNKFLKTINDSGFTDKLAKSAEAGKEKLSGAADAISEQANNIADAVSDYVKKNPFAGLGIAALAGLIIGAIIQR